MDTAKNQINGADNGTRTRNTTLEESDVTVTLYPHILIGFAPCPAWFEQVQVEESNFASPIWTAIALSISYSVLLSYVDGDQ